MPDVQQYIIKPKTRCKDVAYTRKLAYAGNLLNICYAFQNAECLTKEK